MVFGMLFLEGDHRMTFYPASPEFPPRYEQACSGDRRHDCHRCYSHASALAWVCNSGLNPSTP
jgi:hypothetical protein